MSARCCLMIEIDKCVERKRCCSFLGLCFAYFGALACLMVDKIKNVCRILFNVRVLILFYECFIFLSFVVTFRIAEVEVRCEIYV